MALEIERTDTLTVASDTVGQTWLDQEANRIREAAALAVPTAEIPLHEAYLNGRRDSYNGLREQLAVSHPALEKDLPPALQIDEIRVRRQIVELEQTVDRSLSVAR